MVVNGSGSMTTKEEFGDMQLHLEWASPSEVKGDSQGRGNSGVFLMGKYEVQVLDSFDNRSYSDGQAAAMYGQFPPDVNVCRGPGKWQTYDIFFRAPRFEGEDVARAGARHRDPQRRRRSSRARVHRRHDAQARWPPTGPMRPRGPIQLQDHGNPVRFRNIWLRNL